MPEIPEILNRKVSRRNVLRNIGLGTIGLLTSCVCQKKDTIPVMPTESVKPKEILNIKARIKDKEYIIVEQKNNDPSYISENPKELTNFSLPQEYCKDITWLLAHNYINGDDILNLQIGDPVSLIDQNNIEKKYRIGGALAFAIAEGYPTSDITAPLVLINRDTFLPVHIDPITKKPGQYTTTELFTKLIDLDPNKEDTKGIVVLQTCLKKDDDYEAGRLFVVGYEE